jgi:CRISPR/Cas system CSM-associated protein Csm3 (group 7 of RAMP superfamily)
VNTNKTWVQIDLPFTITVKGPLHIGVGYARGLIQKTVARDADGNVYIPGSTLKGKARNACEDLAKFAGLDICSAPLPREMCGSNGDDCCVICRIFGSPGKSVADGRELFWQDAQFTDEWHKLLATKEFRDNQTTARTQVQLSRTYGTAAEDRLYTSEYTICDLVFEAGISGRLNATPCIIGGQDRGYYEVNLLIAGLLLINNIGGGRSRGAGHCKIAYLSDVVEIQHQQGPKKYDLSDLLETTNSLGQLKSAGGKND